MTQVPLLLALFLVGLAISLALGPRHAVLSCALALPVGIAVAVYAAILLLVARIPYSPWTHGAFVTVIAAAAAVAVVRRGRMDRRTALVALAWAAALAAVAAVVSYINVSRLNYDSHQMVMLGGIIADEGVLETEVVSELQSWGVFQVIVQSMVMYTRQDFIYALQPLFYTSFVALFAVALWHAVGRLGATGSRRTVAVALMTAALFSIGNLVFHFAFVHTNLAAAVYLFGYVVLFWLAEVERDASGLAIAFLCLVAFGIQRIEAPMAVALVLAVTVLMTNLPRRAITPWLAGFSIAVCGWFVLLAQHMPATGRVLTSTRCLGLAGVVAAVFVWWLLSAMAWVRAINRWLPAILPVLAMLALAGTFVLRPEQMFPSLTIWLTTLRTLPQWGWAWYVIVGVFVVADLIPSPPRPRPFVYTIWLILAYILGLAFLTHEPYRFNLVDSANRMTLHVLPLIFFYLGLKVIPVVASVTTESVTKAR